MVNLKFPLLQEKNEPLAFREKSQFLPFTNVGKYGTNFNGKQNDPGLVWWKLGLVGKGEMAGEHRISVGNFWVLADGSTINVKLTVKDQ